MMDSYDEYSYSRTLRFFEAYYPYDNEDVHYADVMLSMNQCKTIDELIAVRERLKEKIEKISYYNTAKLPKDIVDEVSKNNSFTYHPSYTTTIKENLRADINSCYDENVFRLFKEKETITANSCGECFINLSLCWEGSKYKDIIINEARVKANFDAGELLETIAKRNKDFHDHWNTFIGFEKEMNGYNSAKKVVEDDFEYLKQFHWRLLPSQKSLYSEIDREEQKKKEEQARILREKREEEVKKREEYAKYLKEQKVKQEEEKRKREEETIRKQQSTNNYGFLFGVLFFIAIVVAIVVLICVYVPSELMNWFFAIIVWLAIMKTILNKI